MWAGGMDYHLATPALAALAHAKTAVIYKGSEASVTTPR